MDAPVRGLNTRETGRLKLAFCLFKYFPYSGLARDFMRILTECRDRGHDVHVFVADWQGERPDGVTIIQLPSYRMMNHAHNAAFYRGMRKHLKNNEFDAVIGFNKMPGLNIYYGADYCYVGRANPRYGPLYRITPRYHHFFTYERSVFSPQSNTGILALSEREKTVYQQFYGTPENRFLMLPPTLDKARKFSECRESARKRMREQLDVPQGANMLLFIGSGFKTKGLDRGLRALASLPETVRNNTRLIVVGQDNVQPFCRIASRVGVRDNVKFLGGRTDIPDLLSAGDLLLHPAYSENTGTVLLEAITAGLPVLTTDVCGYAEHIQEANAGVVLRSPFGQEDLDNQLAYMLQSSLKKQWSENGLAYGANPDLYRMPENAADKIESWIAYRQSAEHEPEVTEELGASLYLRDDAKKALAEAPGFEQIMDLSGEVFREAPGRRTVRLERDGRSYFLKSHTGVGWQEIMKNLVYFRLPVLGAMNEWHGVHHLRRIGIDTMNIAGYGTTRGNPARRRSFILTDELKNTISLEDYCASWKHNGTNTLSDLKIKRWLIKRVAEIARDMHLSGANHRDFYLCHFLLNPVTTDGELDQDKSRLYVIDLHRMQIRKRTPVRWAIKDISGLYYSSMDLGMTQRDLFRFMRIYRAKPLREILGSENMFWRRVTWRARNLYKAEKRRALQRKELEQARVAPIV